MVEKEMVMTGNGRNPRGESRREKGNIRERSGRGEDRRAAESPSGARGEQGAWLPFLVLAAGLLLLDQLTKALVLSSLPLGESVTLIPRLLWLTHVRNTGASFSILAGQNTLLLLVALVVLGLLLYWHDTFNTRIERGCFALIIAGLLGNLVDRIRFGGVTDFLDLGWWPVFNVADSALVVGVLLLVAHELSRKGRAGIRTKREK